MQTAAANEIKSNIGPDFNMLDAFDAKYLDTDAAPSSYQPGDWMKDEPVEVPVQRVGAGLGVVLPQGPGRFRFVSGAAYRPVEADLMSVSKRQALNADMADWFGI